eukprot:11769460-Alexandrium_andersonii.AAC.1
MAEQLCLARDPAARLAHVKIALLDLAGLTVGLERLIQLVGLSAHLRGVLAVLLEDVLLGHG